MSAVARPVRHFVPPATLAGRLWHLRYTLARRALQFGLLLAFFGTAHWGWTVAGRPLLAGTLSASKLAGVVPFADPFAVLQMLVARHWLATEVLIGAALTLGTYVLVTCKAGEQMLKARLAPDAVIPAAGDSVRLQVLGTHTCFYANEELVA